MTNGLFDPTAPGPLGLRNRIAMGPMTRTRAPGNVPNALEPGSKVFRQE